MNEPFMCSACNRLCDGGKDCNTRGWGLCHCGNFRAPKRPDNYEETEASRTEVEIGGERLTHSSGEGQHG